MRMSKGLLGMSLARSLDGAAIGLTPAPAPTPAPLAASHIYTFEPNPAAPEWIASTYPSLVFNEAIDNHFDEMDPEFSGYFPSSFRSYNELSVISSEDSKHGGFSGKIGDEYGFSYQDPDILFPGDFCLELFVKSTDLASKKLSTIICGVGESFGSNLFFGIAGPDLMSSGWVAQVEVTQSEDEPSSFYTHISETNFVNRLILARGFGEPIFFDLDRTFNENQWTHVALFRSGGMLNVALDGFVGTPIASPGAFDLYSPPNGVIFGGSLAAEFPMALTGFIDSIRIYSNGSPYEHANFTPPTGPFTA